MCEYKIIQIKPLQSIAQVQCVKIYILQKSYWLFRILFIQPCANRRHAISIPHVWPELASVIISRLRVRYSGGKGNQHKQHA